MLLCVHSLRWIFHIDWTCIEIYTKVNAFQTHKFETMLIFIFRSGFFSYFFFLSFDIRFWFYKRHQLYSFTFSTDIVCLPYRIHYEAAVNTRITHNINRLAIDSNGLFGSYFNRNHFMLQITTVSAWKCAFCLKKM